MSAGPATPCDAAEAGVAGDPGPAVAGSGGAASSAAVPSTNSGAVSTRGLVSAARGEDSSSSASCSSPNLRAVTNTRCSRDPTVSL
ncbi:Protein of unknown function [Propionibacterium freudenreichii]|nr:Protein of unknown function [Propionibacterium freudenreichii]